MLQNPQYKSENEVKFMNTLLSTSQNKRKKTIKGGKIPLVRQDVTMVTSWPAGNPTETKFEREEQYFNEAEDEPYYASKEVERLEDDLSRDTTTPKSDIIERITEGRHQRHKKALEDLHEELGHLNKATDPQIAEALTSTKDQLEFKVSEIRILFGGIEKDTVLYTFPLKRLEQLWDDVVNLLQKRANHIDELNKCLDGLEVKRRNNISAILQNYNILFRKIAYLSDDAIDVVMDNELYSSNLLLLENYKHYARIISQIKIENVVKLRSLRLLWEKRVATWRDLHITDTKNKFVKFMNTPAIHNCPDITSTTTLMEKELGCLYTRRVEKVKKVQDLTPPNLSEQKVQRWYQGVCEITLLLENTNSKYLNKLEGVGVAVTRDCEEVARLMLDVLQEEGVLSSEDAEQLYKQDLMTLIVGWDSRHKQHLLELEEQFTNKAAQFKADLHELYEFQCGSARIWAHYQHNLQVKNSELISMMKKCRAKHDEINQGLESALDMNMDKMRQDTNELDLQNNLDISIAALKDIAAAYNRFETDLVEVIKKYPGMIMSQLDKYSVEIKQHVGHEPDPVEHQEEEFQIADSKPSKPQYIDTMFKELSETVGNNYIQHLNNVLKCSVEEETQVSVEEKLAELKSEIELRHHIHAPRSMRMRLDIYNVRLNELKAHGERVKQHAAGIALNIATLRNQFKELGTQHVTKGSTFKSLVDGCEDALPKLDKTAQLSSLQTKVSTAHQEHRDNIKLELSTFRNQMEERLNDLRQSNQHFGMAFKPFAEGGNFGPEEIEKYRKKLEKCNVKIDNCETYILTELDGMESKCLDTALEITNNFESKVKMHLQDVAFCEKINSWMSNCQVRIKTEVAACNMMSKKLKEDLEVLAKLIDNCAHPHPDKPVVLPEQVLESIPAIYKLFNERILYLDCATQSALARAQQGPSVEGGVTDPATSWIQQGTDIHSAVNLGKNIMSLTRKRTVGTDSSDDKKRNFGDSAGPATKYAWFVDVENGTAAPPNKEEVRSRRRKSRGDTAKTKRGSRSGSISSPLMCAVQESSPSFMPIIKRILQETHGALYLSSEGYYSQYPAGPPAGSQPRTEIADNIENCMEQLNKRLNSYYLQADEYYNKCIQDLRALLTDLLNLHVDVPQLLFDQILEKHITQVTQNTSKIKLHFEKRSAVLEESKENNKSQLKPILGHPNNEVDLNNLCRLEEDRRFEAEQVINSFVKDMSDTELDVAEQFMDYNNECVVRLLTLFDQLITTDDVILGNVAEKRLAAAVLLKAERRALHSTGPETRMVGLLTEEGKRLKQLHISDITGQQSSVEAVYLEPSKFTPVHKEVMLARDMICEQYRERYTNTIREINDISEKWRNSENKWDKQWATSVGHVKNLYKPAS